MCGAAGSASCSAEMQMSSDRGHSAPRPSSVCVRVRMCVIGAWDGSEVAPFTEVLRDGDKDEILLMEKNEEQLWLSKLTNLNN